MSLNMPHADNDRRLAADERGLAAGWGDWFSRRGAFAGPALNSDREGAECDTDTDWLTESYTTPSCMLMPEMDDGPFYFPHEIRRNLARNQKGLPLELRFVVINALTDERMAHAIVDIWHCGAGGPYLNPAASGAVSSERAPPAFATAASAAAPLHDLQFLHGVQRTSRHGIATMSTIYPGWYHGRALHVHVKVHVASQDVAGKVSYTGQIYMPEALNVEVAKREPYVHNPIARVTNDADFLYRQWGGAKAEFTVMHSHRGLRSLGERGTCMRATIALGVNPQAVPAGT